MAEPMAELTADSMADLRVDSMAVLMVVSLVDTKGRCLAVTKAA